MKNLFKFIGLAVFGVLMFLAARDLLHNLKYIGENLRNFYIVGLGFTAASAIEVLSLVMLIVGAIKGLTGGRVGSTNSGIVLYAVALIGYALFGLISALQFMPFFQALIEVIGSMIRYIISLIIVAVVAKLMEKEK